jgi:hypothetical protein
MRILRRLATLTRHEWALALEATIALGVAALRIAVLPFHRVVSTAGRGDALPAVEREEQVARVRWAVVACARRLPWRTKCFEQGLAAQSMLRRRGIPSSLHYGLAKREDRQLIAHVWLKSGSLDVVGCENIEDFVEFACFPG